MPNLLKVKEIIMARPNQDQVYKNKLSKEQKRALELRIDFLAKQNDHITSVYDALTEMATGKATGENVRVADLAAVKFYIQLWEKSPTEILKSIEELVENGAINAGEAERHLATVARFSTKAN